MDPVTASMIASAGISLGLKKKDLNIKLLKE
jgi:hypothetical protein